MSKDYYKILGVEKSASQEEIKKAFRKVAHQHHPDKQGGDEIKFKEANEAYQVLSDEKKRAQYDRFGSAGPNPFGGSSGGQGFDPNMWGGGFGGGNVHFDFGDIDFGDIFGGFGGGRSRSKQRKGQDIETQIELSFKESVFGVSKTIAVDHILNCSECSGKGSEPGKETETTTCPECNGQGSVTSQMMGIFTTRIECPTCHGAGTVPKHKCNHCKGAGVERKKESIEFTIPAGIANADTLRIPRKGNAIQNGEPGDLYVHIIVKPDQKFGRRGLDLLLGYEMKLSDAILGAEAEILMLDGTKLTITIPTGTTSGSTLKISGRGIVTERSKGDLLITTKLIVPKNVSKKAKEALEILRNEGL